LRIKIWEVNRGLGKPNLTGENFYGLFHIATDGVPEIEGEIGVKRTKFLSLSRGALNSQILISLSWFCDPYFLDPDLLRVVNMKRTLLVVTLVAAITAGGVSAASAVQDLFLKIDGIQGESLDRAHANEIDVLSWSWGATNSSVVRGGGAGAGKATFSDLSITKYVDASSPALVAAVSTGKRITSLILTVRRANGAPQGVDYFTLTLNDVLVSGISVSTSGGEDRMTENVTFNYGTYTYSYTPIKKDGSKLSPLTTKFNIMENRLG